MRMICVLLFLSGCAWGVKENMGYRLEKDFKNEVKLEVVK